MIVTEGNWFRKRFELREDTEVRGGNFAFADVATNGFTLNRVGGNWKGARVDGVKLDSYVFERKEPDPVAVEMFKSLPIAMHPAWVWLAGNVKLTQEATLAAYVSWGGSVVYFGDLVRAVMDGLGVEDWTGLLSEIAERSAEAWAGEPVVVVEVIS